MVEQIMINQNNNKKKMEKTTYYVEEHFIRCLLAFNEQTATKQAWH